MNERGSRATHLFVDSIPLGLQFMGTFVGTFVMARALSGRNQAVYLLAVPIVSQLGFFSDFGRAASFLIRNNENDEDLFLLLGQTMRKTVPISILTSTIGILVLITLPLAKRFSFSELLLITAGAVAGTVTINLANLLRVVLLIQRRTTAYFWSALWALAFLPFAASVSVIPLVGIFGASVLYLLQELVLLGSASRRDLIAGLRSRPERSPDREPTTAVGISLLALAVSTTADLAIVARFAPSSLLAYYGVTRLAQAFLGFAYRPLERGTPDIALSVRSSDAGRRSAAGAAWRTRRLEAYALGVIGAVVTVAVAPWFTGRWLGHAGRADLVVTSLLCMGSLVTLANRERVLIGMSVKSGQAIVVHSLGELVLRVSVGGVLLGVLNSVRGLALGAIVPAALLMLPRPKAPADPVRPGNCDHESSGGGDE